MRLLFSLIPLFFFPLIALAQTSTPCNQFQGGSTPPAGYGAAWNVLSSSRELLLTSTCFSSGEATRRIGVGNQSHYIYKSGYRFHSGAWAPFEWTGTFAQNSIDWLIGQGTQNNFQIAGMPEPYYWVGYVCQWNGSIWKCGCKDAACATNYWQLQAFDFPGTSGGTTGATTGGTTGGGSARDQFWAGKGYQLKWQKTPSASEVGMDGETWVRTKFNNGYPLASAGFNPSGGSLSIVNGPGGTPAFKGVIFRHPNENAWVINVTAQQLGPKGPESPAVFSVEWYTPCEGGYKINSTKVGNYLGYRIFGAADNVTHSPGGGTSYPDAWAIRVVNGASSNVFKMYTYIPSMDHPSKPNRGQIDASDVVAQCDKWWLIEVEVISNTVGQANGIYRLYLDGKMEKEVTGEVFRHFPTVRPRGFGIVLWHNGGTEQDEAYFMRNWKIYHK